jgi:hypothetical protein
VLRRDKGGVVMKRKFRHYADGEPPAEGPRQPDRPRDGQGTIWVAEDQDGYWSASWQDGPRIQNAEWSTEADAIKWALDTPAKARFIFDDTLDEHRPIS